MNDLIMLVFYIGSFGVGAFIYLIISVIMLVQADKYSTKDKIFVLIMALALFCLTYFAIGTYGPMSVVDNSMVIMALISGVVIYYIFTYKKEWRSRKKLMYMLLLGFLVVFVPYIKTDMANTLPKGFNIADLFAKINIFGNHTLLGFLFLIACILLMRKYIRLKNAEIIDNSKPQESSEEEISID